MRTSLAVAMVVVAVLEGCAAQGQTPPPASYKNPVVAEFARDRERCMQEAAFAAPGGGKITFGGGYGGNPFIASGPYMDCMVARGYKADAIGDVLGTPGTEKSMGGL